MPAARSPCRCFKTRVLHFKVKNTPLKDKKWKEKVQRNALFSFCEGKEAFHQEMVLRGIQPCFLHDVACARLSDSIVVTYMYWSAWSVLKCKQGSEVFTEFSGSFCTLWPRQLRFWKGIYVFLNVSETFYKFFSSALRKNYKMCPDLRSILC